MRKIILIIVAFLLIITISTAHQPRIVSDDSTLIKNPETSQAFYGELDGKPHYYKIDSEEPYKLYVSLSVPDIKDIDKDVSAKITRKHEDEHKDFHVLLNGTEHNWTRYYEEFGGDYYFRGSTFEKGNNDGYPQGVNVSNGTYNIKVFSPDNEGKYVLVVGYKETWSIGEFINAILTMPELKSEFFEKSPLTAYFNLIGLFFFATVAVVVALLAYVGFKLNKHLNKRKS
ncbi:hypothetical protein [Methanohalobium sp.]|uniref:hypothetical protein n=1 Tax=Methanohalobium sp. TaxID=2837493 RepID=UPI0025CC43E8|nr:hypothetical protein [Methanohalobium sp.]